MMLSVKSHSGTYPVYFYRGALGNLSDLLRLHRKVLLVSDRGIPKAYVDQVAAAIESPHLILLEAGEAAKSMDNYQALLTYLVEHAFTRKDAILALGGGVVGDLAGFLAATYLQGVDFYYLPTSLLAQVDGAIGGKTALHFQGQANILGTYTAPKAVVIDPGLLSTLSNRQRASGMAEIIKTALVLKPGLYNYLCTRPPYEGLESVMESCIRSKIRVVEEDEVGKGVRRILQFGHTLGHAIEAQSDLLHGEALAIGMTYFTTKPVLRTLFPLLEKYQLPAFSKIRTALLYDSIRHDLRSDGNGLHAVFLEKPGKARILRLSFEEIKEVIQKRQVPAHLL